MAHKKGVGSSRNGRDSNAQRRGVKRFGGETLKQYMPLAGRPVLRHAVDAVNSNPSRDARIKMVTEIVSSDTDVDFDAEGRYIKVTIQDSGAGIQASDLAHVFDPFFTTKEMGGGSGLGLAITRDMITQLGGEVALGSSARGGARATIRRMARIALPNPGGARFGAALFLA